MKTFEIIYHMNPMPDIVITHRANSETEAIIFAKQYRQDAFSIKKVANNKDHD